MPWLSLVPPTEAQVEQLLEDSKGHTFNYTDVQSTCNATPSSIKLPAGPLWRLDHIRVQLGTGKATYTAAKALLQRWRQFQLGWCEVSPDTRITPGQPVAVVAKTLFLWTGNPLRIVYTQEDNGAGSASSGSGHKAQRQRRGLHWLPGFLGGSAPQRPLRWQFAHGCLDGHMLAGEESFRLHWDPQDDTVWYEVLTFSRPAHPLALLSYPLTRYYQQRFARESAAALLDGLRGVTPPLRDS